MQEKRRHIITFILALSMLLSGMCFENTKADFLLEYASEAESNAYLAAYGGAISNGEICTTEMLGIRNISCIRQFINRSIYLRRNVKASFVSLCTNVPPGLHSNFVATASILQLPELCFRAVVLNYIHNQDGKKRIE